MTSQAANCLYCAPVYLFLIFFFPNFCCYFYLHSIFFLAATRSTVPFFHIFLAVMPQTQHLHICLLLQMLALLVCIYVCVCMRKSLLHMAVGVLGSVGTALHNCAFSYAKFYGTWLRATTWQSYTNAHTCTAVLCVWGTASVCVFEFFMHAKVIGREVAQQLTFSIAIFTVLELLHLLMLHTHTYYIHI